MAEFTTVIGRESIYSRGKHQAPKPPGRPKKQAYKTKPEDTVAIYTIGRFVTIMPVRLATRFSMAASVAFPAPGKTGNATNVVTATSIDSSTSGNGTQKTLDLKLDTLFYQPSVEAFQTISGWMHRAKHAPRTRTVTALIINKPEDVSLWYLFDCYAATVVLGTRPYCSTLRHEIEARLKNTRIAIEHLIYVNEHLPTKDGVTEYFINLWLERCANKEYDDAELKVFNDYIETCYEPLFDEVQRIKEERKRIADNKAWAACRRGWNGGGNGRQ